MQKAKSSSPLSWIPSLYFAEGLPYAAVNTIAAVMFKSLGMANEDVTFYLFWLGMPWVLKFIWSPFVNMYKTKRWWILSVQLLLGAAFASVAFSISASSWIQYTVASLFLLSFSSATHDIACDGFYLLVQTPHDQAAYVGVRNTAYRIAMIFSQGVLVMLAGYLEKTTGNKPFSWMIVFGVLAVLFLVLYIYHLFLLPKSESKEEIVKTSKEVMKEFGDTFVAFFKKKQLLAAIFFMLIYRFGEAQITAMGKLFMMDKISAGGLGLSTSEIGFLYGTVAVVFLLLGGILGGVLIARKGLKFWLWPMALAINIPHLTYVYLSQAYPHSLDVISICVAIEQFGYGFGFSAYLVFLMFFSEGSYKTAHYAICTAFMALGMNIPTLLSGYLQKCLGYPNFFLWIMGCMVLTFIAVALIKVDKDYAKKASG